VYAHSIGDDRMAPEVILGPRGVCKALDKAKRDGLTRFVGVSGHNRPGRFLQVMQAWDYDVQMNAVSLVARHIYDFESRVWPEAVRKKIGLAAMKVFGGIAEHPKSAQGARMPRELLPSALRYALGLPGVSVVVVGMYDDKELAQVLTWTRQFRPLSSEELAALTPVTRALAAKWGRVYGEAT